MNDRDVALHTRDARHLGAVRDSHDADDARDGTSSSSDGDDRRSSDANTSHVPSKRVRTTIPANNPSTRDYAMHTMRHSRTNRR